MVQLDEIGVEVLEESEGTLLIADVFISFVLGHFFFVDAKGFWRIVAVIFGDGVGLEA